MFTLHEILHSNPKFEDAMRYFLLVVALALVSGLSVSTRVVTFSQPRSACMHSARMRSARIVAMAAKRKPPGKNKGVDFSALGSVDASGYRRGSFGIGENESKVLWVIVAAALVFGGKLDERTAQDIGSAQRNAYPAGLAPSEKVLEIRAKAKATREERFRAYFGDGKTEQNPGAPKKKAYQLY